MKLNIGFNFTDLVDSLWSLTFSGNPQCCVMPHTMLSVAKNFGTNNNSIGNQVPPITDSMSIHAHMAQNICDTALHFHLSLSGMASIITLVFTPSAC